MKRNGLTEILLRVYLHCWYVPLLAFLLGLKICLISLLMDNMEKGGRVQLAADSEPVGSWKSSNHPNFRNKRLASAGIPSTTIIPNSLREEWETLANLENSYILPTAINRTDPNSIWLIFNRIPRCGGETMVDLLISLSDRNRFNHQEHEYRTPWPRFLLEQEQESLVTWFEYQHLPKSYDRHFYFVNFTRFQKYVKEQPIYVNLIREPVHRLRSFFQSKRSNPDIAKAEIQRRNEQSPNSGLIWYQKSFEDCVLSSDPECYFENESQDFTMAVPFFCGQQPPCVIINNKWALQRAKFTIEKYYSVVGVLEKLNETLKIFEHYVPRFFSGATELYSESNQKSRRDKNHEISEPVRVILEKKLPAEVDLYLFINQRLSAQYNFLVDRGFIRRPPFQEKSFDDS